MAQNTWTGSILELENAGDLLAGESDEFIDAPLQRGLEGYFFNHLVGISNLTGGGTLIPIWPDVEEEITSHGLIAVVEYNQQKFLALVGESKRGLTSNLLRRWDNVTLTLLANNRVVLESSKTKDPRGSPYPYVVFQNNRDGTGHLALIRYYIKNMIDCVKKARRDLYMSEKRLIVISKEELDKIDVNAFLKGWAKGILVVMSLQHSRRPSKEARLEGKQGISPHDISFSVYEPKSDERAKIIRDFNWWLSLAERLTGVRSDVLKDKEERAPVQEVLNSQAAFDAFEKNGAKWRLKGIREYMAVFKESAEETNYKLEYGKTEQKA